MLDKECLADWEQMHAALMDKERQLADLAVDHAMGVASEEDLSALQGEVTRMREKADEIFQKAFGVARRRSREGE